MRNRTVNPRGFTLLELQVAIILLAFGVVTLASLLATQGRLLRSLRGDFKPGATLYVTQSSDPWVRKLAAAARVTADAPDPTSAPAVTAMNTVELVDKQADLLEESMTATVDVVPIE